MLLNSWGPLNSWAESSGGGQSAAAEAAMRERVRREIAQGEKEISELIKRIEEVELTPLQQEIETGSVSVGQTKVSIEPPAKPVTKVFEATPLEEIKDDVVKNIAVAMRKAELEEYEIKLQEYKQQLERDEEELMFFVFVDMESDG